VDNQYDHGPIIVQRVVAVVEGDSVQSLAARVFAAECEAYPQAIAWFAAGRLQVRGRWVQLL
jgi:phosphoribosylglycinamide formyltransferase-1